MPASTLAADVEKFQTAFASVNGEFISEYTRNMKKVRILTMIMYVDVKPSVSVFLVGRGREF